jgi:transposase
MIADIITPCAGGSTMRQITTLGIDTAKQVFQLHGVDAQGNVVLHQQVSRKQLLPLLAQLPPCLVGLEACGGSHYWAREITTLGHTVKLMAPQAVKPYVQGNKTDGRDAEGICEAASRPRVRPVAINSAADQVSLSRLNHGQPGVQAHPEVVQGTAEFHHQIADALLPQADPVCDDAAALDTPVDLRDPQPTLVQRLVRHVLLQRELRAAWLLGRHEDRHLRERERQEAQIL